jgi:hypothetical protein
MGLDIYLSVWFVQNKKNKGTADTRFCLLKYVKTMAMLSWAHAPARKSYADIKFIHGPAGTHLPLPPHALDTDSTCEYATHSAMI